MWTVHGEAVKALAVPIARITRQADVSIPLAPDITYGAGQRWTELNSKRTGEHMSYVDGLHATDLGFRRRTRSPSDARLEQRDCRSVGRSSGERVNANGCTMTQSAAASTAPSPPHPPPPPPRAARQSLFIVPKYVVDGTGRPGEHNDVVVAGLNHKMGYRGTTNTVLSFGEGRYRPGGEPGAVGEMIGSEGDGLAYMFHMTNEARVVVGAGAVALGYTGYLRSLEYARGRVQGRLPGRKDTGNPPVPIIRHPDVRRMLLTQKAIVEGGLALILYCARLVDDQRTAPPEADRVKAATLLDVLTPIAKAWPSQWCLHANDLAIQVLGGYGYTRDYPLEQFYRDNRLNPIHEGTNGIQALDLLGRKVRLNDGAGLALLLQTMPTTVARADGNDSLAGYATDLSRCIDRIESTTRRLWESGDPAIALANASAYLDVVGHTTVAWLWLEQLLAVGDRTGAFFERQARRNRHFFRYLLPTVHPMLDLLDSLDTSARPGWAAGRGAGALPPRLTIAVKVSIATRKPARRGGAPAGHPSIGRRFAASRQPMGRPCADRLPPLRGECGPVATTERTASTVDCLQRRPRGNNAAAAPG